jgi:protein MpaA
VTSRPALAPPGATLALAVLAAALLAVTVPAAAQPAGGSAGTAAADGSAPAGALAAQGAAEARVIGRSVRGRSIVARRYGPVDAERVGLVVGVIHGDERAGLEIVRRLRRMPEHLGDAQLWVIDALNPDGSRARSRGNAHGVDLNRNFPFRWQGGVPRASGYYPGPRPVSEPETRAAMSFIREIQPDVSVWYHQPWGAVLACRGRPELAARYARLSGARTSCRGKGRRGTAISWQNATFPGTTAFVVELVAGAPAGRTATHHARAAATIVRDG